MMSTLPAEPQAKRINTSHPSKSDIASPDSATPIMPEVLATPVAVADVVAPAVADVVAPAVADVVAPAVAETPVVAAAQPSIAEAQPVANTPAASEPAAVTHSAPVSLVPAMAMSGDSIAALRLPQPTYIPTRVAPHEVASPARGPWRVVGFSLLALTVAGIGGVFGTYTAWRSRGQLAAGLVIQGQPVGGLTQAQAEQRLKQRFGRLFLTVHTPDKAYKLGLSELGGKPQLATVARNAYWYGRSGNLVANVIKVFHTRQDEHRIALPMQWDKAQLRRKMWIVAAQYKLKPHNARLEVTSDGVRVLPHQEGRAINVGATLKQLQHRYYVGLPTLEATVEHVLPRLTAASLAGTDIQLNNYTTRFDAGQVGRSRNLRIAAAAINGQVVMPGEVFSFNKKTGERTAKKGYRMAHIFARQPGEEESQVIEGLAGGTCQVSSTLFNAVRRTNNKAGSHLKIVEHNHHSLPVTYVPSGLDATVAWPDKDFKFRNTFPYPVYLRAAVNGEKLTMSVWARVPQNVNSILIPDSAPTTSVATTATTAAHSLSKRAAAKAARSAAAGRHAESL